MITASVHLITYNNEEHIEETILSILKQKVEFNYEIIVGDDCSTDNTLNIINQYKKNHPQLFKVKKNETQLGILRNFKTTLDRCQGHYIFDIAGDDILKHEYTLQKMINVLNTDSSLGFVDSGFDKLTVENKSIRKYNNKKHIVASKEVYKEKVLLGQVAPIGICYNRNHLYKYVDFDSYIDMGITIEDYPILVDLIMNTNFDMIKESLHIYRVHDNSYSHKRTFESHYFLKNQMKRLFDYFSEKYQYDNNLIKTFNKDYFKELLFLSGYFEEKQLGKETFKKIESKNIRDYIHFLASQSPFFRKLVSML
ncbi:MULTISPECIES: glycosyltransferase family 2 protein [Hwangdonia]|uniref:Glycosyltransferase family 2 protein n=1 Tax=Hwangdonia seohaensis TaxID=1240727 RepID=A0ABW3RFP7_9FLAO|nr:glycosyltransferase family 2 protein [Hwangdonia seohaensis]